MTDIIVKIMIELLLVLALATKQIKQGRFSKRAITIYIACCSMSRLHREICEEVVGGERDRGSPPKIGSIDSGRGSDDCCADLKRGPWSRRQCEGSYGRCGKLARLFPDNFLMAVSLDGKASTDSIRQDLGM